MSEAHCHTAAGTEARAGARPSSWSGNPNVGKSVVFNALTGTYVDVSNFPGTTVELTRGRLGEHDVVDTPGVYGVCSFNDEETVARDIILSGDIVINVVDAVHLERDLFLTLQLVDMGKRMVVALNMADEARKRGRRDRPRPARGPARRAGDRDRRRRGQGLRRAQGGASRAPARGHADLELERRHRRDGRRASARGPRRCWCSRATRSSASGTASSRATARDAIYLRRRHRVNDICGHVITETDAGRVASRRSSRTR